MRGGHFGGRTGKLKFIGIIVLRNTNRKGQRTELKILGLRSVERNKDPLTQRFLIVGVFLFRPQQLQHRTPSPHLQQLSSHRGAIRTSEFKSILKVEYL